MISHNDFLKIFDYIKNRTEISIVESNINAVRRFVHKKSDGIMDISSYISLLASNPQEFQELLKVVTINETYFFREQKYYKLIDKVIFPEFKTLGINPTIWSGATSTGEEAISLALIYQKHFSPVVGKTPIMATDIDVLSMDTIRLNRFPSSSIRSDGESFHQIIENNSSITNGFITFNRDILDIIETKRVNLIKDDFSKLLNRKPNLICLCNVLIYMDSAIRKSIIDRAVDILEYGGYLLLSSSNTAFVEHPELELLERDSCFYFKKIERDANE